MKKTVSRILWVATLATIPFTLFADWSHDTQSVESVRKCKEDDRTVYVKGTINRLEGDSGFFLSDDSGEVFVHCDSKALKDHDFKTGSKVEVKGKVKCDGHHHHTSIKATAVKLSDGKVIE